VVVLLPEDGAVVVVSAGGVGSTLGKVVVDVGEVGSVAAGTLVPGGWPVVAGALDSVVGPVVAGEDGSGVDDVVADSGAVGLDVGVPAVAAVVWCAGADDGVGEVAASSGGTAGPSGTRLGAGALVGTAVGVGACRLGVTLPRTTVGVLPARSDPACWLSSELSTDDDVPPAGPRLRSASRRSAPSPPNASAAAASTGTSSTGWKARDCPWRLRRFRTVHPLTVRRPSGAVLQRSSAVPRRSLRLCTGEFP
jgi:hypothetical protein